MHAAETFEAYLRQQAREGSSAGIFEPDSLVWQVNRQRILYLGGLRAILMQLAHPLVAHGVAEHSDFTSDPLGRFARTMGVVQDVLFGDRDTALKAARRVYRLHSKVRGRAPAGACKSGYCATDPELLLWVYATLIDSLMFIHDTLLPELGRPQWEQLYQQGRPFAHLFGVPDDCLPPDLAAFEDYVTGQIDSLDITPISIAMAWKVLSCPHRLFRPLNSLLATGSLPPRLRTAYGLPWNPVLRKMYSSVLLAPKFLARWAPATLRIVPVARRREKLRRNPNEQNRSGA